MKKCLFFVTLLIVSQLNIVRAQSLFTGPDTVCVRQPVAFTTNDTNASSYYWGFCSGYLMDKPLGANLGDSFNLANPSDIQIAEDGGNFYAFVTNKTTGELLRLSYGTSLTNKPTVTNLGSLGGKLVSLPASIYIVKDSAAGNWFIFVGGGDNNTNSSLCRLDFGSTLSNNVPNVVNFGNPGNVLKGPRGIFVAKEASNWYGFFVNNNSSSFVRMDFGNNISLTPTITDEGNIGGLSFPTDMAPTQDNSGNWYFFVTNAGSSLVEVTMGSTLTDTLPSSFPLGNPSSALNGPSSISLIKDCGSLYAFITNESTNELIQMTIPNFTGPYTAADFGNIGKENVPSAISRLIRSGDNIYGYIVNQGDSSLTQVTFAKCTNSSIPSSNLATPPAVVYDTPGVYNVYFVVNEGMPNMQVQCMQVTVLPTPAMRLSDDTSICQGDSVVLIAESGFASSFTWQPQYNMSILDSTGNIVRVWPAYPLDYHLVMTYPDGCVVDTFINVHVSKVKADAGPDRTISDGATTLLGGPLTSTGTGYSYTWFPPLYLSNTGVTNPNASPHSDFTYYLQVTELNDSLQCQSIDTVVVHVDCGSLYLPNAFSPGSANQGANTFGILNRQVVQLTYFNVFDRWGNEVFTTTDPFKKWDGTFNGQDEPMGVYVWEIEGYCETGKKFTRSGNVTLIR